MTEKMNLTVFDPHAAMVADLVQKNSQQEFDHTTEEGEKGLRSWVHRIKGARGDLERSRKATKADALAFGTKVDARAKELDAPLVEMIAENMKPLNEIEAKKRADAEAIVEQERVAAEKAEAERLADLERREAEMAEKERVVREAEIAEKAAAQAKADAKAAVKQAEQEKINAEQRAKDAAARAEREKQEAVEAERSRLQAEAKAKEDAVAEEKRIDDIEKKRLIQIEAERVADKEHRTEIEDEIRKALFPFIGTNSVIARNIIAAIQKGTIPHLTINY